MTNTTQKTAVERMELWELERLIPSARNARTHSEGQVAEIAGSIRAFGFIAPVLVDGSGSILAGHGRVLAARQLKLERIPVLVVEHLTDAQMRAYSIADNKIALNAGWDEDLLKIELETLVAEGIEPGSLGFSDEEFKLLIDQLKPEPIPNNNWVPEVPTKAVTQVGDVWELGEHQLLCGDPRDPISYETLLGENKGTMAFTSVSSTEYRAIGAASDEVQGFRGFLDTAFKRLLERTTGALYICAPPLELHTVQTVFCNAGGHCSSILIWGRNGLPSGKSDYLRQYEPILYGWTEGEPHFWCGARDQGDVWTMEDSESGTWNSKNKPVELIERAIVNSSRPGNMVLDPFAGMGSTIIACEKTERAGRLIEGEPKYCDMIISRWQEHTGKQAVHILSGETFVEVSVKRSLEQSE